MGSSLLTEQSGGVLIATINRAEKMNALNKDLYEELSYLTDRIETAQLRRLHERPLCGSPSQRLHLLRLRRDHYFFETFYHYLLRHFTFF